MFILLQCHISCFSVTVSTSHSLSHQLMKWCIKIYFFKNNGEGWEVWGLRLRADQIFFYQNAKAGFLVILSYSITFLIWLILPCSLAVKTTLRGSDRVAGWFGGWAFLWLCAYAFNCVMSYSMSGGRCSVPRVGPPGALNPRCSPLQPLSDVQHAEASSALPMH